MNKSKCLTAMILSAALSGNVWADLNDGLVAYYPFNGNARDESGNFNDGIERGNIEYKSGDFGTFAYFNGSSYIEIPNSNSLTLNNQITISALVKIHPNTKNGTTILQKGRSGVIWDYGLSTYFSYPSYKSSRKDWIIEETRNHNDNFDNVYLFTVIVDEKNENVPVFYLNSNKLVGNLNSHDNSILSDNDWIRQSSFSLQIGLGHPGVFLIGEVYELRIYNRALSESEIQQLYQPCQPFIDIILNSNNRVTGDKVVINSHIKAPASSDSSCQPSKVTAKVWAKLPNNSIIPLMKPLTGLNLLPGDDINTKIFQYIFRGAEPIGSYEISGRLLDQLTGDSISTDIETLIFSNISK